MINVYLALMEGGEGNISPDDRDLILKALFRPTSTGLVQDDAARAPRHRLYSKRWLEDAVAPPGPPLSGTEAEASPRCETAALT